MTIRSHPSDPAVFDNRLVRVLDLDLDRLARDVRGFCRRGGSA